MVRFAIGRRQKHFCNKNILSRNRVYLVLEAQFLKLREEIYQEHLQYLLWNLEQEPQLWQAFAQVLQAAAPVELELITAFKLQSMGLVHLQDKHATVSCELYCRYFRDRLQPRA